MLIDFIKKLGDESLKWVSDGIITDDQRLRIIRKYEDEAALEEKTGSSRFIATLSIMGAVLVGVGIILFVASNWDKIPRMVRVAALVFWMTAFYFTGWWFSCERRSYPRIGAALILVGAIIYGAAIFLIAQIYNISVHYPNGILMWWVLSLPLAYLTRNVPVLVLSLGLVLAWFGSEASFHMLDGDERHWLMMYMVLSLMLFEVGRFQRKFNPGFAAVYEIIGLFCSFGIMFAMTFDDFYRSNLDISGAGWFFVIPCAITLVSLASRAWKGMLKGDGIEVVFVFSGLIAAFVFAYVFKGYSDAWGSVIAANIIYAALVVGLIVLGYRKRSRIYVGAGLGFFVLDVIARYFDMFFDLLPRSILFIGGGVLLLVLGFFAERQRRRMLLRFASGGAHVSGQ